MFAPNAVAVMDTGFPTDDTSVPNAASDLGDGRNCAAQDPYAADAVGFWRSILCARTSGASQPFNWRQCLERPIKPPGICLSACVPLWVSEFDDAYFGGPTTGKKRGCGTEKAKVFVALSLDERGKPRFLKMRVTLNIKQAYVKKFTMPLLTMAARSTAMAIAVTSRRWNAIPMNTNPTIPIPAFSIGCTSSSATPRHLFWAPIMACPRSTFNPTWTNIPSVSAAAASAVP